jgi:mannose/cellobiose epimerase-like protein (N-acyl-D-glucosamine 2-epimerase family)
VWEHYRPDWSVDWDYNFNDRSNIFKPWGFQPGHQTEWAKLLLILESYAPEPWYLPKAQQLFDYALTQAWDHEHGGMVYGLDRDGAFYDTDKYYWVQAESLAAAAMLATRTGEERYWQAYRKLWEYSWQHLVDHRYGAWYRILSRDNQSYSDEKSPAGKTDYHTMGACYDVLAWIG